MRTRRIEATSLINHPAGDIQPNEIVEMSPLMAMSLLTTGRARIIFKNGVPAPDEFDREWDGDPVNFLLRIKE